MLFPVKVRVALAGLVVAAGGVAAALLGPAGPAVGQASGPIQVQIQVNSPASLLVRGAGAEVTVTASCSGPLVESGSISVSLDERTGSEIAEGFGSTGIDCTGLSQTLQVIVTAQGSRPFKRGTAIADAVIQACSVNFGSCADQEVTPTIQIGG